jgi:hypothetical protein
VRFEVDKVAIGHVFLVVLRSFPVSIFPPMAHTHLHRHVALTRSRNGQIIKLKKQCSVGNWGALGIELLSRLVFEVLTSIGMLRRDVLVTFIMCPQQ